MQRLMEGDPQGGPSSSSDNQPGLSVAQDGEQPLRLPHECPEALRLLDPNMGLGRGLNSRRIQEVVPGGMSPTEPYKQGTSVNTELSSLIGIGRGNPL
jgi:hypothetical protein